MTWHPHVTVAAVIEKDGLFLMVEEIIDGQLRLNQPAGHWEDNETLVDAVIRETLEETAWHFHPRSLIGVYQWRHPEKDTTFLRFAFCGDVTSETDQPLDKEIVRACWLSHEEIIARRDQHRSPQVLTCIDDYLAGKRADMSLLHVL